MTTNAMAQWFLPTSRSIWLTAEHAQAELRRRPETDHAIRHNRCCGNPEHQAAARPLGMTDTSGQPVRQGTSRTSERDWMRPAI